MSYVRNVVAMFSAFAEKQHNILLTANVQMAGIAEKLLERIAKNDRPSHIVNLLDYGRLSNVQQNAISDFRKILKRILTAKMVKRLTDGRIAKYPESYGRRCTCFE